MQDLRESNAWKANPALLPLAFLIGEWRTQGTHPLRPGKLLEGHTAFRWHLGGAFIVMHSHVEDPDFPDGIALIGSDDAAGTFSMIYHDERGISRIETVTAESGVVTVRRDNPHFAQSLTITAQVDGSLVSKGQMSQDGGSWGDDLSQTFTREA